MNDSTPSEQTLPLTRTQALWLMAIGYGALALFSITLSRQPGNLAVFWFANAWAVAMLLTRTRQDAPLLLAVQLLTNVALNLAWGDALLLSLAFGVCNAVEVGLAAWMLARFSQVSAVMEVPAKFMQALLLGALAPALVGASLGSGVLSLAGLAPAAVVWPGWLLGSLFGYFALAPLAMFFLYQRTVGPLIRPRWYNTLQMLVLLALALVVHTVHPQHYILILVPMLVVLYLAPPMEGAAANWLLGLGLAVVESLEWQQAAAQGIKVDVVVDMLPNLALLLCYAVLVSQTKANRLAQDSIARLALQRVYALEHSERAAAELQQVLDATGLGRFWVEPTLNQVRIDAGACHLLGLPAKEGITTISQAQFDQLLSPASRERMQRGWQSPQTQHGVIQFEVLLPDATSRWLEGIYDQQVDEQGRLLRRWGFVRDVTDREAQAQTLAALQQEQQTILDTASVGLCHAQNRRFIWVNAELARMLGYRVQDMVGQPVRDFFADEDKWSEVAERALELSAAGQDFHTLDYRMLHQDGHTVEMEGRVRLLDRASVEVIVAFRDVTDERAAAQAVEKALIAARSGEQAKEDFLTVISHEIRTPLNGVMGMLQLLEMQPQLDPESRAYAQQGYQSSQLLLTILNDVLDFGGLQKGRLPVTPAPMQLSTLVAYLHELEGSLVLERGVVFDVQSHIGSDLVVSADELRLKQILLNLVNNAVKFTAKGLVKVAVMVHQVQADSAHIELMVSDTGLGMSEETQARLFTPFMQADMSMTRKYGGTGLGLAIAKGLVEEMGGRIDVDSRLRVGSTFSVHLDLPVLQGLSLNTPWLSQAQLRAANANEDARLLALTRASEYAASQSVQNKPKENDKSQGEELRALKGKLDGVHVLIVEDEPSNARVESAMLTSVGASTTLRFNALEALAVIAEPNCGVDVVLMDLQMPHMSGIQATQELRNSGEERLVKMPVIGISGNIMRGEPQQAMAAGMNDFLAKPADLQSMVAAICRALGR